MNPSHIVENGSLELEGNGTPPGPANCHGNNNVTLNGTAAVSVAEQLNYCPYREITYTLCSIGPAGPELRFEGQFNSFIRPRTSEWSIGIFPLNLYNNAWNNILPTITTEASNPGNLPTGFCGPTAGSPPFGMPPEDVVGLNGSFIFPVSPAQNYGLGYYNFDFQIKRPNITDAIVVWEGGTKTNPSFATQAFVIRVEILDLIPGPDNNNDGQPDSFTSRVVFDYRRAL